MVPERVTLLHFVVVVFSAPGAAATSGMRRCASAALMVAQDAPEDMDPVAALKWALSGGEGRLGTAGASTKRERLLAIKKQHEEEEAAAGARTIVGIVLL